MESKLLQIYQTRLGSSNIIKQQQQKRNLPGRDKVYTLVGGGLRIIK